MADHRLHGVRCVHAGELDPNAPQARAMNRAPGETRRTTTPMAETNEYELQALWWKRVLSAFTARHDRQEIPYVVELLRCVGDQRATETAHRAWLLTRRDRADAIAEIRILVAHAEELAEL